MSLYFYINKNLMFDFLGRNIIAPDPIVRDIKRYRTLGTVSDHFLFVTHKKLNRKSREQGIAEPEYVYPVTLELAAQDNDGQALLVSMGETGLEYTLSRMAEYNPERHIGAYLIGEIPLSRVDKIYFDTQDEQDMFSRPSPDYWYPVNKYALLPEDFTENFSIAPEEDKLIAASGLAPDEILSSIRKREKQRAAVLNFINGTQKWQYGKYVFNIDASLQQLLGMKDEEIAPVLPHYQESRDQDNVEYICLVNESSEKSAEFNQQIFDHIQDALTVQPYNNQKQPEQIIDILNGLCERITAECKTPAEQNIIRRSIVEIEKLISDSSNKGPEEIMAGIPEPVDVLKALLFVAKNPNRYELFMEALEAYHADLLTKRRAAVLWGSLNGLYGMPGEDYNKDNQELWQFIEGMVYNREADIAPSLVVNLPDVVIKQGKVLGITLKEERIVTAAEIREYILSLPKERLTENLYSKLMEAAEIEAGSKKKAENKGYAHCIASIALPEIKTGDELNAGVRKVLEQLLKDCKNPVSNKEKLFSDYIADEKKFAYVFDIDPEYWKRAFRAALEKKNA